MIAKATYTLERVRQLQRSLYRSAKISPERKYYTLYDKVCRMDVLEMAWQKVAKNGGAAGIDGQTILEEFTKIEVQVNTQKSRLVNQKFGFLGFEIQRVRSRGKKWWPYLIPKMKKRT